MTRVQLTQEEREILAASEVIPEWCRRRLGVARSRGIEIDLSDDEVDALIDACSAAFAVTGLDEDEEPTRVGLVFEEIIDKLLATDRRGSGDRH